jgi:ketosteroid isomerase-like protein
MPKGRTAIESYWRAAMTDGLKNLVLKTVDFEDFGSVASEIGRFSAEMTNGKGTMARVEGKHVTI